MTPRGQTVSGEKYFDTRWVLASRDEGADGRFADQLATLIEKLSPHEAYFDELRAAGGKVEVIVGFLGDGYYGDSVPLETISKLANLKIE